MRLADPLSIVGLKFCAFCTHCIQSAARQLLPFMSKPLLVEVINFGDELLVGIRENAHLTYLGEQLAQYGLPIQRARIITDDREEIRTAFRDAWEHSDVVITTGGLGPTADDLTRETSYNFV